MPPFAAYGSRVPLVKFLRAPIWDSMSYYGFILIVSIDRRIRLIVGQFPMTNCLLRMLVLYTCNCLTCRVRAVIKEDPKSPGDTICREPRHGRRRLVYISRGSLVEVRLATGNRISTSGVTSSSRPADRPAENQAEYFLVEYEGLVAASS